MRRIRLFNSPYALAILAGVLLACAFPKIGLGGFAWIGPGAFLAAGFTGGGWQRFRVGYVAGLVFYTVSLYWLLNIPFRWMGVPVGPAAGLLALSAYLALYPAFWVWLITTAARPRDGMQCITWAEAAEALAQKGWISRTALGLYAAVTWVALEMVIARLFSGFPWDLLGVSQYQLIPLIQIATVTGIYGISFIVVWISVSLLMAAVMIVRRPSTRALWSLEVALPFGVVGFLVFHGMRVVREDSGEPARTLKVALVQPSIPQTLIWDSSKNEERFEQVIELSEAALAAKPDLLIWPESAVPALFRQDEETRNAITGLARRHSTWMIIGADDFSAKPGAKTDRDVQYYNASFLISPDGAVMDTYRKRSLVIFGEYVPLERWIPFIKYFTPIEGGFTPGDRSEQFELDSLGVVTSVLICFEDIFPTLGREGSQPDTDFLVNLTNNGWFGEGAAQWQHGATSVFRAVENRITLVRCSNNGLTCWVDKFGRIRQVFRDAAGSEYGPGFMLCEIPLLGVDELREPTPYHRHGDRFGWTCVLLTVLWMPFGGLKRASVSLPSKPHRP
jgi:apolipoprotein N-acyltransferase